MKKKWWAASLAVAMVITSVPAIPAAVYAAEPMLIEAEDYSSYSGKLKVMTNNKNASGGKYVGDFDYTDSWNDTGWRNCSSELWRKCFRENFNPKYKELEYLSGCDSNAVAG